MDLRHDYSKTFVVIVIIYAYIYISDNTADAAADPATTEGGPYMFLHESECFLANVSLETMYNLSLQLRLHYLSPLNITAVSHNSVVMDKILKSHKQATLKFAR